MKFPSLSTGSVTLLAPGLFGSPVHRSVAERFPAESVETLSLLLSRAKVDSGWPKGLAATLFGWAGVEGDPSQDWPVAAVARVGETGEEDPRWWLRADPIHLRADRDQVLLFDGSDLAIGEEEAATLAEALNQLYAEDGWRLEPLHPQRWYLSVPEAPRIRTSPLPQAVGGDVRDHFPSGPDGGRWRGTLTEVQMLLHNHSVNQQREARGKPTINGLWMWGGGRCPAVQTVPWQRVWSDEPLSHGLARLAGGSAAPLPDTGEAWLSAYERQGPELIVLDALERAAGDPDPVVWFDHLARLEQQWVVPLWQGLKQGYVDELWLVPGNGEAYRLERRALGYFWRRRRSFGRLLKASRL